MSKDPGGIYPHQDEPDDGVGNTVDYGNVGASGLSIEFVSAAIGEIEYLLEGESVKFVVADDEFVMVGTSQVSPGLGFVRVPAPPPSHLTNAALNHQANQLDALAATIESAATSANAARTRGNITESIWRDGEGGAAFAITLMFLRAAALRRQARETREEAAKHPQW